jgi:hypothetical protein
MRAATVTPARSGAGPFRLGLPRSAWAVWLEFKRNAVPYVLPLLAAVFYYDTYRTAAGYPPVWTLRASVIGGHMVFEFTAFAAGLGAWAGSREGRRKTSDLVSTTARTAWARQGITLAATMGWLLLAFLAGVAVVYIQTAVQATWGGPPLWPVFVGVAAVTAATLIGFAAGVFFPGRFTAPLAAIGTLVLEQVGFHQALSISRASSRYALLSPDQGPVSADAGVYYHVAPDVSVVQVMFMGGIAVALFGLIGLAPAVRELARVRGRVSLRTALARHDGWLPSLVAVILVACGVAASATAFTLAGTAKPDSVAGGWQIPALHSAASDQPTSAATECTTGSRLTVCVAPAFSFYLHDVAALLDPIAAQISGLPGAPVRAQEMASVSGGQQVMSGISGNPPVFDFTANHVGFFFGLFNGYDSVGWPEGFQDGMLNAFLQEPAPQAGFAPLDPAQQAIENALRTVAGSAPQDALSGIEMNGKVVTRQAAAEISAATQRFVNLSASARRGWLAAHLTALRAGQISLAQIP